MGKEKQKLYALLKSVFSLPNLNSNFPLIWEWAQGNLKHAVHKFIQIFEDSWREEKVIELANKVEFEKKGIKVMKL